jgi:hypothetical protein
MFTADCRTPRAPSTHPCPSLLASEQGEGQGCVLGALGVLQSAVNICGSLWNVIYAEYVDWAPELCFYVGSCCAGLALLLTFCASWLRVGTMLPCRSEQNGGFTGFPKAKAAGPPWIKWHWDSVILHLNCREFVTWIVWMGTSCLDLFCKIVKCLTVILNIYSSNSQFRYT